MLGKFLRKFPPQILMTVTSFNSNLKSSLVFIQDGWIRWPCSHQFYFLSHINIKYLCGSRPTTNPGHFASTVEGVECFNKVNKHKETKATMQTLYQSTKKLSVSCDQPMPFSPTVPPCWQNASAEYEVGFKKGIN